MSMPIIKPSGVTRCGAVTDIIESVALQQTGLSHILNAEGEKIQLALQLAKTPEELLAVNDSVESMVNSITRLEAMLQGKLALFKDCICTNCNKPCTLPVLTLEMENENGGTISAKGENAYIFTPGLDNATINFTTNPEATITPLTELPSGMEFINNQLTISNEIVYAMDYELIFQIGEVDNAYTITFYADLAA